MKIQTWIGCTLVVLLSQTLPFTVSDVILSAIEGGGSRGRLNAIVNGRRGTVCDDEASNALAAVVCRQLGFNTSNAIITSRPPSAGSTSLPIVLDNVICVGTETSLAECRYQKDHNCGHSEDIWIDCQIEYDDLNARLVGSAPNLGRVEIYYNKTWGTVCRSGFDQNEATVICNQLGFNGSLAVIVGSPVTGDGTGPIWMSYLQCTGSENNIASCRHSGFGLNSCDHGQDMGVYCPTSAEAIADALQARLVGPSPNRGLLEVNIFNQSWGSVCDDGFTTQSATVVCRMLGLPTSHAMVAAPTVFGEGTGPIWMSNIQCTGSEDNIASCTNSGIGIHSCSHAEDIGIYCPSSAEASANALQVRLVGGPYPGGGRLEVNIFNQSWDTVCDDGFTNLSAVVVCRMLGLPTENARSQQHGQGGQGRPSQRILLDDVRCTGNETSILLCRHRGLGINDCSHSEDVWVYCSRSASGPNTPDVIVSAIEGGGSKGRLNAIVNGRRGTVCDDEASNALAAVVCRQLGFNTSNAIITSVPSSAGPTSLPIVLDNVICVGTETSLAECQYQKDHNCGHSEDLGIDCLQAPNAPDTIVSAIEGGGSRGRLIAIVRGRRGTVCDDEASNALAAVVCRQLGFNTSNAIITKVPSSAGPTSLPIVLDNVVCVGTETSLAECQHRTDHNCGHDEDLGVDCQTGYDGLNIRLFGNTSNLGRVEINYNNTWGTVCRNNFNQHDATVICNQLGFNGSLAMIVGSPVTGEGTGPIWISHVQCTGSEDNIASCRHSGYGVHSCSHTEDVGVFCPSSAEAIADTLQARLVGSSPDRGRLEVNIFNQSWGTVCDDGFTNETAVVVCRMLGLPTFHAMAAAPTVFGQGTGPIWMSFVQCTGSEANIANCRKSGIGISSCDHGEDVGIYCPSSAEASDNALQVRLVGGPSPEGGRLEVNIFNQSWDTVCDDGFTSQSAAVVCRMLGVPTANARSQQSGERGQGRPSQRILLDDVRCTGNETSILLCRHRGLGINDCSHSEDVWVYCTRSSSDVIVSAIEGGGSKGRLNAIVNGRRGTVCDDEASNALAAVVCRQLGFNTSNAIITKVPPSAGPTSLPIVLDNVICLGTETSLAECRYQKVHNCGHSEDLGVDCQTALSTKTPEGIVSIEGGGSRGRLIAMISGRKGTVCDDEASNALAAVVCRQLGFNTSNAIITKVPPSAGPTSLPIVLDNVICVGTETSLAECRYQTDHNCNHDEDLGVDCQTGYDGLNIRLFGNASNNIGRLEINYNNTWGTICNQNFNQDDAAVICNQLGFNRSLAMMVGSVVTGEGTGPIWISDVQCTGSEDNIASCRHSGYGVHSCSHSEDVGVYCPSSAEDSAGILQARLVGPIPDGGRLEVNIFNQSWSTVCDDGFTSLSAAVICRMLGLPTSRAMALGPTVFGEGTGPIWISNVQCTGSEDNIASCRHSGYGIHSCSHSEDVGVYCPSSAEAIANILQARLVGPSLDRGRLEVNIFNQSWGSVCDDGFTTRSAAVVCRMLGLPTSMAMFFGASVFGQGTGPIWMSRVQCTGSEANIALCSHSGYGVHSCNHGKDVSIFCPSSAEASADILQARLVGSTGNKGRLEVRVFNQSWGTVCDDGFTNRSAAVVCRMLGFPTTNARVRLGEYGTGSNLQSILLDDVQCTGNEPNIFLCPHSGLGTHNCGHSEDVGVFCQSTETPEGIVSIEGGGSRGRLIAMISGRKGTVCDDEASNALAAVVCRQLGFNTSRAIITKVPPSAGPTSLPIVLDNVVCVGTETSLAECRYQTDHNCNHDEDLGVDCQTGYDGLNIRLFGNASNNIGRLEINYNNTWGTVCSQNFNQDDAAVICNQLGFNRSLAMIVGSAVTGEGTGPIWISDVQCTGSEDNIASCRHSGYGVHSCSHSEDVGVYCPSSAEDIAGILQARLVGPIPDGGRLEVNIFNQSWSTVCDDGFTSLSAAVVCRMLGLPTSRAMALGPTVFGEGTGPILMSNVQCSGSEDNIASCRHSGYGVHSCSHSEDVGVYCPSSTEAIANILQARLVGPSPDRGRLEVNIFNQSWGSVCDDGFTTQTAAVVCRMLGLPTSMAMFLGASVFGQGTGPIWMSRVQCTGSKANIALCSHSGYGVHSCNHGKDVSVYCPSSAEASADVLQARLVGSNGNKGRLEVRVFNQSWGTVCDDGFTNRSAAVVCRMLGFPTANARVGEYGRGSSVQSILLDDVQCTGNEPNIFRCPHSGVGAHNCDHSEDVGVFCHPSDVTPPTSDVIVSAIEGGGSKGRLNAIVNGRRGTVCDDEASNALAAVVCRQLGFNTSNAIITSVPSSAGRTSLPIVLDNVICVGTETSLAECRYQKVHNCDHSEDLGVDCQTVPDISDITVSIEGGGSRGRLNAIVNGREGTVCDDEASNALAAVVCRQLGFNTSIAIITKVPPSAGSTSLPIVLDNVVCVGTEPSLAECQYQTDHNCGHSEDLGIDCQTEYSGLTLRLVGGGPNLGRVEINYNNTWGTICRQGVNSNAAIVICKQLGFNRSSAAIAKTRITGQGTGPIWISSLQCTGSEVNIASCRHSGYGVHSCSHAEDVGVFCPSSNLPDVIMSTIEGGGNKGRLIAFVNGREGTVCDDEASNALAVVVCRQLGFNTSNAIITSVPSSAGRTSLPIVLDNVICVGTETSLAECRYQKNHNCDHSEDLGIDCKLDTPDIIVSSIQGGGSRGRLIAIVNGRWGTVCDDEASNALAAVVCRQLGFNTSNAIITKVPPSAGSTSLPIVLDNVVCVGTETSLTECPHETENNCIHDEDLGIDCQTGYNGLNVRLAGHTANYGRVEINYKNTWGTVCKLNFGQPDAAVICNQLGFNGSLAVIVGPAITGEGTGPIWISDVQCTGSEDNIASCRHSGYGVHSCSHPDDVGVYCPSNAEDSAGILQARLVGPIPEGGRLEVNIFNQSWGTVCDDGFTSQSATVVCRMLGLPTSWAMALGPTVFGEGTGPILMSNVQCTGPEISIASCTQSGYGVHSCGHAEDIGIYCPSSAEASAAILQARLVGPSPDRGRLEVRVFNQSWGTVCDDGFTTQSAAVVCRMLGLPSSLALFFDTSVFGQGTGSILMTNVRCNGSEASIAHCYNSGYGVHSCTHAEDVGVFCPANQEAIASLVQARLVGSSPNRGRLEVKFFNRPWGTVCDDGFTNRSAAVVCRMLGFPTTNAQVLRGVYYERGHHWQNIVLDDVQCTGNEPVISLCHHSGVGAHNCDHSEDVGVFCQPSAAKTTEAVEPSTSSATQETSEPPVEWTSSSEEETTEAIEEGITSAEEKTTELLVPATSSPKDESLPVWAIVLGAVAFIVVLAIIIAVVMIFIRRRKSGKAAIDDFFEIPLVERQGNCFSSDHDQNQMET